MRTPLRVPADAAARRRATTGFERNHVVLAGAGTGKTSLLVERLLVALGLGRVEIREIAAITFTEKAAAEMRERLADGLEELRAAAAGDRMPDPTRASGRTFAYLTGEGGVTRDLVEQRSLSALGDLEAASIGTLHAFCLDLLRSNPFEALVDPSLRVDGGEALSALAVSTWDTFVARELGPDALRADLWLRVLERIPLSEIRNAALELARRPAAFDLIEAKALVVDARALLAPPARRLREGIGDLLDRHPEIAGLPRDFLAAMARVLEALADAGIREAREALEKEKALDRVDVPKAGKKVVNDTRTRYKEIALEGRRLLKGLESIDDGLLGRLTEAIAPFLGEIREEGLRRGRITFDGILHQALSLLRDPSSRRTVRRRFRMILVDELQDTDPIQYDILFFLAEQDGGRADEPYRATLEPGRLFVVGDAKQSIYRFRGADYAAFRRAVLRIEEQGGEILNLTENFRSVPALLGPINRLFEGSANPVWTDSPYQPAYVPIEASREHSSTTSPIELWTVRSAPGALAGDRRLAEGRAIAGRILELTRDGFAFRDILILLRAFTDLDLYLRALRQAGIPFAVGSGKSFRERPEVKHLAAVLRALSNPADPVALLAYLRSPAGGVPDTELARWATEGGPWDRSSCPDATRFPALQSALVALVDLEQETRELPADAVAYHVLDRCRLTVLSAFAYEGAQRVANLEKLAASLAELTRSGGMTLLQALDALEDNEGNEVDSDSPLADASRNAVRLLTIHSAKGLESPVVVLPDLGRTGGTSRRSTASARILRSTEGPALALQAGGFRNPAHLLLEIEDEAHQRAEATRLLYVALTRARERLLLFASTPKRNDTLPPWLEALGRWGYSATDPPADGPLAAEPDVLHGVWEKTPANATLSATPLEGAEEAVRAYESLVSSTRARAKPSFVAPSRETDELGGPRALARTATARDLARAVGIVVHHFLEREMSPASRKRAEIESTLSRIAKRVAEEEDLDPARLVAESLTILDAMRRSPLAARLERLQVLGREVPLLLRREDGTVVRGSVDLIYREGDGPVVVVDYKTDAQAEGAAERYASQLELYRTAVGRALGLRHPCGAEIWLLRRGEVLSIT